MSISVDINDQLVEAVVLAELRDHIGVLKKLIVKAKNRRKKLRDFEKQDLANNEEVLAAMQLLLGYYGGGK